MDLFSTESHLPPPPIGYDETHTLSNMIAFCLHYLGCSNNGIWLVLRSYGFTKDERSVDEYIRYNNLVNARDGHRRPKTGRKAYMQGTYLENGDLVNTYVHIDYRDSYPIQVRINYRSLPQMDPLEVVDVPSGYNRLVRTQARQGQVLCYLI